MKNVNRVTEDTFDSGNGRLGIWTNSFANTTKKAKENVKNLICSLSGAMQQSITQPKIN